MDHDHSHHDHAIGDSCHPVKKKIDFLYYGAIAIIVVAYAIHLLFPDLPENALGKFVHQVFHMMNDMWWGIALGVVAVGFLNQIPREMVMRYFVRGPKLISMAKATLAGTLFDLCNHGVLILGMKIYERGASLGQTMAFLISSPWNSLSLTLILASLVGWKLTTLFVILSMAIAIVTGLVFDFLVEKGILPGHAYSHVGYAPIPPMKFSMTPGYFWNVLKHGFKDSKMIFKWIFIGLVLSAAVSALMTPEMFTEYFGNSVKGLFLTLAAATGLEVCSEGFVPLAADLVRIAQAPGNAFVFLMAGVATDLTEILVIRQTMKSWKVALYLPLITVPQIVLFGYLINIGVL